jgi:hypothetical protein
MANTWNTLHIFAYGQCQLIGDNYNKLVDTAELSSAVVAAAVTEVWSHKPADSTASGNYHAINNFNGMFADWLPQTGDSFRVQWTDLNATPINALAEEILAYAPPTTTIVP